MVDQISEGHLMNDDSNHAAGPAALGFYYQSFFALKTLLALTGDEGAVAIESADDVELKDNGQRLLFQLKHTLTASPAPISISSKGLWRTLKAWIDVLPRLTLSETRFHLVTVAPIAEGSELEVLNTPEGDRQQLLAALVSEAERVVAEREAAAQAGNPLPHKDRFAGCQAFLKLTLEARLNLLRQARTQAGSLAKEADALFQLLSQFNIGSSTNSRHSMPTPVLTASRPVASPARQMLAKVSNAFHGNAAIKNNSWEEF